MKISIQRETEPSLPQSYVSLDLFCPCYSPLILMQYNPLQLLTPSSWAGVCQVTIVAECWSGTLEKIPPCSG